jgi:conjugal transfer pilus assembly protein TraA|nr:TraA family conjugative transfer protein [Stenotrophomonas pavanii]
MKTTTIEPFENNSKTLNSKTTTYLQDNGLLILAMLALAGAAVASSGNASTGGSEFADLYNLILGWTEGVLGKTIAVASFLIGMVMGVAKQSIWAFAIGILFAAALAFGPSIIEGVFTAGFELPTTLPALR